MAEKFTVACSPLSGTIFAGRPIKHGMWGKIKHDVTEAAVAAVAQHLHQKQVYHEYVIDGKTYELRFTEVKNDDTDESKPKE